MGNHAKLTSLIWAQKTLFLPKPHTALTEPTPCSWGPRSNCAGERIHSQPSDKLESCFQTQPPKLSQPLKKHAMVKYKIILVGWDGHKLLINFKITQVFFDAKTFCLKVSKALFPACPPLLKNWCFLKHCFADFKFWSVVNDPSSFGYFFASACNALQTPTSYVETLVILIQNRQKKTVSTQFSPETPLFAEY